MVSTVIWESDMKSKRKKGTEEEQASLSNSINRTTLAQRCEKNSSQNIVLPS